MSEARRLLGQILKSRGAVREGHVQAGLVEQRKAGGLIGQILVEMGHTSLDEVTQALAEQAGLQSVDLTTVVPSEEALEKIDGATANAYGLLPLRMEAGALVVAIADPMNVGMLEDLSFSTGCEVRAEVAEGKLLREKVAEFFGEESLSDAIAAAASISGGDAADAAQSKPVVRLLNSILHQAIKDRASDIHFETYESDFRIRYRVDGSLYEVESPPAHLSVPLIARIKVMSDLDIAETRMPQDGRIELSIEGRPVDLRVATIPGIAGEGCVLRVLDRGAVSLNLTHLGLSEEEDRRLRAFTQLPHGIVLITGPTGSGKTTTLYAMLSEANDPSVKIITAEDPVEYDIDGIVQVPVNPDIGVDYPQVLRTVLRQDPDKILIGEIRDQPTGAVAVEASLTGHAVFSTLHTNDAPSAITRLVDLGIEPFLITATLEAVIAQRLVRKICEDCKENYQPDAEVLRELGPDGERMAGSTFSFGKGCDKCHHTGYRGRMGIFEIMPITEPIREAIQERASTAELRAKAERAGMVRLRKSGLRAVTEGRTSLEEVLRETMGA